MSALSPKERRDKRREIELLSSESRWLQKALFALQKAEAAREKLAGQGDEGAPAFDLAFEGGRMSADDFQDALETRIQHLITSVKERRRTLR